MPRLDIGFIHLPHDLCQPTPALLTQNFPSPWQEEGNKGWGKTLTPQAFESQFHTNDDWEHPMFAKTSQVLAWVYTNLIAGIDIFLVYC